MIRSTSIALGALVLAAACASVASRPSRSLAFAVRWNGSPPALTTNDVRPTLSVPAGTPLEPSASGAFAHPVVADAANSLFTPASSSNSDTLIRLTDAAGADLVPALPVTTDVGPLLQAMTAALRAAHCTVPEYLALVADEYAPARRQTARFAVSCYWKGEQKLGALPGVIATRTGSLEGEETIEAEFDPTRVSGDAVAALAKGMTCYRKAIDDTAAPLDTSNQQQYHLWLNKPWHFVPLTRLQATRVNAALVARESPDRFLSPTQVAIQRRLQRLYDRDARALDAFETLNVDRTPEGIAAYARRLLSRID